MKSFDCEMNRAVTAMDTVLDQYTVLDLFMDISSSDPAWARAACVG